MAAVASVVNFAIAAAVDLAHVLAAVGLAHVLAAAVESTAAVEQVVFAADVWQAWGGVQFLIVNRKVVPAVPVQLVKFQLMPTPTTQLGLLEISSIQILQQSATTPCWWMNETT
jgi:hypothetical protein